MKLDKSTYEVISNLQDNQLLKCTKTKDTVSFEPVDKSKISFGRKIQAFFGFGPYKLRTIAWIMKSAMPENSAEIPKDALTKLNSRIQQFNDTGIRKYISSLRIESFSNDPNDTTNATARTAKQTFKPQTFNPAHAGKDKSTDIMRVCSNDPIAVYSDKSFSEIQELSAKIKECFHDTEMQKQYYPDKEHPGQIILSMSDIHDKFPETKKFTGADFKKALLYMLTTKEIYSVANARVSGTLQIGLDAAHTENIENKGEFYNLDQLVQLDDFIQKNTLVTPQDTPADLKPLIDAIAINFNKQLRSIFRHQVSSYSVLPNNDLYKISGPTQASHGKAEEAFRFLAKNGIIHSWNNHSHQGYYVQMRATDRLVENATFDNKWRTLAAPEKTPFRA